MNSSAQRLAAACLVSCALAFAVATAAGCARKPLPEEGTPAATLYVETCGGCHAVYRPELLTAGMWDAMVDRMEREMIRRRVKLSPDDKAEILAYLARNAGQR